MSGQARHLHCYCYCYYCYNEDDDRWSIVVAGVVVVVGHMKVLVLDYYHYDVYYRLVVEFGMMAVEVVVDDDEDGDCYGLVWTMKELNIVVVIVDDEPVEIEEWLYYHCYYCRLYPHWNFYS